MTMTSDKKDNAYEQFNQWLVKQPFWLQDATYRIYNGQVINEKQIDDYVSMCIAEAKKEEAYFKHIDYNDLKNNNTALQLAVLKLNSIVGVNDLAEDAELEFSPVGVTAVYGLNGAGKSGFMRIFKQVSGNPYEEPIQPNVFNKGPVEKPSCVFKIHINGSEQNIECELDNKTKKTVLIGCDVFDTRISNAYINNTNSPSYQPFVFTVISALSRIAEMISNKIKNKIESIPSPQIAIPNGLVISSDASWINNINEKTIIPEDYSVWKPEQETRLTELVKLLDTEKVKEQLVLQKRQRDSIVPIINDLFTANRIVGSDKIKTIYMDYLAKKERMLTAEKLFTDKADKFDYISVTSQDWKSLWLIAKSYYEDKIQREDNKQFGEEGSICPLCHQEITGKVAIRCQGVNEYINGVCSEEYRNSLSALRDVYNTVCNRSYTKNLIKQNCVGIIDEEKIEIIETVYSRLAEIKDETDVVKIYDLICKICISDAIDILEKRKKEYEVEISKLQTALMDDNRIKMEQEIQQLKCHKWIYESLMTIREKISYAQRKKELKDTMALLTTNKITSESNFLADMLISEAYINRFNSELKKLSPKIRVKLEKAASRKGNSPYKVILDSGIKCKTEDILSEGEQRIVALAAFFAEATGRDDQTPIIIDDPISSLDKNYENSATRRIVELARNRQVIVFTHRISLLIGIKETCEELGVQYKENHIRATSHGKGRPDFDDLFRGGLGEQLDGIQRRLFEIKGMDEDSREYSEALLKACQQFRICIERSVEEVLFLGMVRRFDRHIITKGKVDKMSRITDDDCNIINSMMTKYSYIVHSQPVDSPAFEIGIDSLASDVSSFAAWIREYKKRMK